MKENSLLSRDDVILLIHPGLFSACVCVCVCAWDCVFKEGYIYWPRNPGISPHISVVYLPLWPFISSLSRCADSFKISILHNQPLSPSSLFSAKWDLLKGFAKWIDFSESLRIFGMKFFRFWYFFLELLITINIIKRC